MDGNYYWLLSGFGGFLGYWLLGYYLREYPIAMSCNIRWIAVVGGTCLYPLMIFIIKADGHFSEAMMGDLQIGSALLVTFLYTVFQNLRLKQSIQNFMTRIAKYSFCIYLTHIYIARELYWGIFESSSIHIFPRTFIIALLTLATGYLLTWLLARLPYGKCITGA